MTSVRETVKLQYGRALEDYLANPDEAGLQRAYEVGRQAVAAKLGVLAFTHFHQKAIERHFAAVPSEERNSALIQKGAQFFMESLAAFEMNYRGFQDANAALFHLNQRLEEEARRIAHALHDEAGQLLTCVHISLEEIAREMPPSTRERLGQVRELLHETEDQLRRLSHELRPAILDDFGLLAALEFVAEGVSKRGGLCIRVEGRPNGRFPFMVETALYRVVQEALTNVMKHARARNAWVRVWQEKGGVGCLVEDDGAGFDPAVARAQKDRQSLGLAGMRERAQALGGTLSIVSKPGLGSRLSVFIPLKDGVSSLPQNRRNESEIRDAGLG